MIQTLSRQIALGPDTFLKLRVVSNVDELIEKAVEEDEIPFWAELWPSAIGLARYIWQEENFAGCTVLELGAGIGLSGLAAALKGGRVLQTDFIPQALDLAAQNAKLNSLGAVTQQRADWRNFPIREQFHRIIGSDILYEPKMHSYLREIFEQNLYDRGQILLADPGRNFAGDFLRSLVGGWQISQTTMEVEEREKIYAITIYKLQKAGGKQASGS